MNAFKKSVRHRTYSMPIPLDDLYHFKQQRMNLWGSGGISNNESHVNNKGKK